MTNKTNHPDESGLAAMAGTIKISGNLKQVTIEKKMWALCIGGEPWHVFPMKESANEAMISAEQAGYTSLGLKAVTVTYNTMRPTGEARS